MSISRERITESDVLPPRHEGLKGVKFWLTLSSLSPLFILLPAKYKEVCALTAQGSWGNRFCASPWSGVIVWSTIVLIFVGIPFLVLILRETISKRDNDSAIITIDSSEDKRDHLIAYLFAVFLPLYQTNANSWPTLLALLFSIGFVIWIFYFLNSYYVNPYFAMRGYRTFLVTPQHRTQLGTRSEPVVLLSKRRHVRADDRIRVLRLGEGVYLED